MKLERWEWKTPIHTHPLHPENFYLSDTSKFCFYHQSKQLCCAVQFMYHRADAEKYGWNSCGFVLDNHSRLSSSFITVFLLGIIFTTRILGHNGNWFHRSFLHITDPQECCLVKPFFPSSHCEKALIGEEEGSPPHTPQFKALFRTFEAGEGDVGFCRSHSCSFVSSFSWPIIHKHPLNPRAPVVLCPWLFLHGLWLHPHTPPFLC